MAACDPGMDPCFWCITGDGSCGCGERVYNTASSVLRCPRWRYCTHMEFPDFGCKTVWGKGHGLQEQLALDSNAGAATSIVLWTLSAFDFLSEKQDTDYPTGLWWRWNQIMYMKMPAPGPDTWEGFANCFLPQSTVSGACRDAIYTNSRSHLKLELWGSWWKILEAFSSHWWTENTSHTVGEAWKVCQIRYQEYSLVPVYKRL